MVVFFALFFKQYLAAGQEVTTSTVWLGALVDNGQAQSTWPLRHEHLGGTR